MRFQTTGSRSNFNRKVVIPVFILVFACGGFFCRGEKNNDRFIPGKLPAGFVFAGSPEFYGTYEKPRENGTIYDYINGGGEVYIKHGFCEVAHMVLEDKAQNSITLDIFNMGTPVNAAAAFADEAICPGGFVETNIGIKAKTYRYEPDFLVYFVEGKYLVSLALTNDALSDMLLRFAAVIYRDIK